MSLNKKRTGEAHQNTGHCWKIHCISEYTFRYKRFTRGSIQLQHRRAGNYPQIAWRYSGRNEDSHRRLEMNNEERWYAWFNQGNNEKYHQWAHWKYWFDDSIKGGRENKRPWRHSKASGERECISIKPISRNKCKDMIDADIWSKVALQKANYNKQYSCKNNIKIMDIQEKDAEKEQELTATVSRLFAAKNVQVSPSKIVTIHRIPGRAYQPKPVLVKLTNNNEKTKMMKKYKEFKVQGNRLVDDVTKMNVDLIKRISEHEAVDQAWYFNGSVFLKTKAGNSFGLKEIWLVWQSRRHNWQRTHQSQIIFQQNVWLSELQTELIDFLADWLIVGWGQWINQPVFSVAYHCPVAGYKHS